MGFQIYDKVLIRISLNQPLLEGFHSELTRVYVLMLMEGYKHEYTSENGEMLRTTRKKLN